MYIELPLLARLGILVLNLRHKLRQRIQLVLRLGPIIGHPIVSDLAHGTHVDAHVRGAVGAIFERVWAERGEAEEGFEGIDLVSGVRDTEGIDGNCCVFEGGHGHC